MDLVWFRPIELTRLNRVRTQTVFQMEATECGVACLAIILAHHRYFASLEQLRDECGVSRDGTNAARLVEVARRHGLRASGFRKEPDELNGVPFPVIIHWNFDHFVVLEGIGRSKAWINDPAHGRRTVSRAEFDRRFTGPVLVFEPGPQFRPQGDPPRIIPALRCWASGWKTTLAFLVITGGLLAATGIALPMLSRIFVDGYLAQNHAGLSQSLLVGMTGTALARGALTWLQRESLARTASALVTELTSQYLWRAMHLPLSFHLARHPIDLASRAEVASRLSWLLCGDVPVAALAAVMTVLYAILLLWMEPRMACAAILFAVAGLAIELSGGKKRSEKANAAIHELTRWTATAAAGLQAIETLKANGVESRFFANWKAGHSKVANSQQSLYLLSELLNSSTRYLHSVGMLAVMGLGAIQVMNGRMSMGTLVAFQSLMASFMAPLRDLTSFAGRIDEIRAQVARFKDVLDHPHIVAGNPPLNLAAPTTHPPQGVPLRGRVDFQKISFGYNRSTPPAIVDFELSLLPGERVAIVGRTGSGKSTIARLACGLYRPWSGEILFDGLSLQDFPPERQSSSIAAVDQEIHLFEGTIEENLTLWDPSLPAEALHRATQDACLDEVLVRLPSGLETRLNEGGLNLSGGERQRLEIARALARDPAILILDEATSALDTLTESAIYDRIRARGCTCLIVAHRLSAVRDCDQIVVLDSGRVIARGRHEHLWKTCEIYRRLILTES